MLTFEPGSVFGSRHLADVFSTAPMRAVFSELNSLKSMLAVEIALAKVEAGLGVIPPEAAAAIASAAKVERLDLDELATGTMRAGLPIVNLVEQLIRLTGKPHGEFVHWGATSQDIMDTALMLQMREALDIVDRDLENLISALSALARTHRDTPMVGRTKLQHAIPITFGYKVSVWLSGLLRHRQRLAELRPRVLQVQFGGAVGTFASLGDGGDRVRAELARELGLAEPLVAWHAARDTLPEVVSFLCLVSTTLSKIATDIVLMAQTEIGEVLEPGGQGHGASSTMPHKRNPIICEQILSSGLSLRRLASAMLDASIHDHERATGPWQAEWLLLPEAFALLSRSLDNTLRLCTGLVVRPDAMQVNLARTQGLIAAEAVMMVLAPHVGRHHAHEIVGAACTHAIASGETLARSLARDPDVTKHLTPPEIEAAADPARYVGLSARETDRVLAACAEPVAPKR